MPLCAYSPPHLISLCDAGCWFSACWSWRRSAVVPTPLKAAVQSRAEQSGVSRMNSVFMNTGYCSAERFSLKIPPTKFTAAFCEEVQRNLCKLWNMHLLLREQWDTHKEDVCWKSSLCKIKKERLCPSRGCLLILAIGPLMVWTEKLQLWSWHVSD